MSNKLVRYCLITGCAGGIGQSLVRGFSSAGYQVIGTEVYKDGNLMKACNSYDNSVVRNMENEYF